MKSIRTFLSRLVISAVALAAPIMSVSGQDGGSTEHPRFGVAVSMGLNLTSTEHAGADLIQQNSDGDAETYSSGTGNLRLEYLFDERWSVIGEISFLSNRRRARIGSTNDAETNNHEQRYEPSFNICGRRTFLSTTNRFRPYLTAGLGLGSMTGYSSVVTPYDKIESSAVNLGVDGGVSYRIFAGLHVEGELEFTYFKHYNVSSDTETWSGADLDFLSVDLAFGLAYRF